MSNDVDMHRIDIVAAIHKQGTTVQELSVSAGLAKGSLANALRRPWPKGERIIAEAIGMAPQEIWPSRYSSKAVA